MDKKQGHFGDVSGDGHVDLISHYKFKDMGLAKGDTEAWMIGRIIGGYQIIGCDRVKLLVK